MNALRAALVRRLADGRPHAEAVLAAQLGIEASLLQRELRALAGWGLQPLALPGEQWRLADPPELLDRGAIEAALGADRLAACLALELHDELDSTNARLLAASPPAPGQWRACLAEYQSAGRGRRGRAWTQPFGGGLCASLGWSFAAPPAGLAALALAAGVAVLRSLDSSGVAGLSLKWPNDVLRDGGKLGGILCELRSDPAGPVYVVVGVGLNVRLSEDARSDILEAGGVDPADLADVPGLSRNALAARLLDSLVRMAGEFAERGFAPFAEAWRAADALRGRPVRVQAAAVEQVGVARGIDADGALCVEIAGELTRLTAGDVSLRAVA